MDLIYKKEANLDEENNLSIDLLADHNIEGNFFKKKKDENVISGLKIKLKEVDLTTWSNFSTIEKISDRINKAKRDNEKKVHHGQILVYLPNFHRFEEDTLIAAEPPKKNYKYINAETKKINSIKFPDYKKWYETLTWYSTCHKNAFKIVFKKIDNSQVLMRIYKERNNHSKYQRILDEMNKIWTMVGDKVYESIDIFYTFYKINWRGIVDLHQVSGNTREIIRQNSFFPETNEAKKVTYIPATHWSYLTLDEQRGVFLASHQQKSGAYFLTVEKLSGVRHFVSERLYLNRKHNFLSKLTTATFKKTNARDTLKINTNQIFIYEVLNQKEVKTPLNWFHPKIKDFTFSEMRNHGWGGFRFDQEHYKFINCTLPDDLQKIIKQYEG